MGNTLEAVSRVLRPRRLDGLDFVQLNGSANALDFMSGFVTDTTARFAQNYGGRAHPFPVPTFFDDPETKRAMWRERSVRHVLDLQARADVLPHSVGSPAARHPSYVYVSGALRLLNTLVTDEVTARALLAPLGEESSRKLGGPADSSSPFT